MDARKHSTDAGKRTRLFQNGNSQAVRIPKEFAFADIETEVEILRRGEELVVRPVRRKLTDLGERFRELGKLVGPIERGDIDQEERDWSGVFDTKTPRR